MEAESRQPRISDVEAVNRYVAFIDILGWGDKVRSDFAETVHLYDELIRGVEDIQEITEQTPVIRIISDSIMLVSPELRPVLQAANLLQHSALFSHCLLRGGIAFGKHCELTANGNLYVLSEALVLAATIERTIHKPCIALHPTAVPVLNCRALLEVPVLQRLLIYFDGTWIVNPFNICWFASAGSWAAHLREKYPDHSDKYDWFLDLYKAVASGEPMIPRG